MRAGGEATRARILEAARAEFAQHGIAGARVDRIAEQSRANKAQLYAYFGSKNALFDAVFSTALHAIVDAVPIDGTDLPGYAVRLYDEYLEHPELIRLAAWSRLERRPTGPLTAEPPPRAEEKLGNIAAAQAAGHIDKDLDPFDVFVTVIALSMAWSPASTTFTASSSDAESDHERRRHVLRTLVARAYAPAGS
ncbi:TetR family transcriptional regulator [Actinoplanes sp. M2I2]|uniref:TetR family transcriptional regulator n=1 Tax=Actinoplanes sp. M2I2 TaxID=1734444 RepID=UPI0020229722|nr:TetR family transcriptional regulator [Actinoplanes sp. M2I2]